MKLTMTLKKKVERDLGYPEYMEYLRSLNGKAPAFGSRNNTKEVLEIEVGGEKEVESDFDGEKDKLFTSLSKTIFDYCGIITGDDIVTTVEVENEL